jgi:hypothetical protein
LKKHSNKKLRPDGIFKQSGFHPSGQRNAFRRRAAHIRKKPMRLIGFGVIAASIIFGVKPFFGL